MCVVHVLYTHMWKLEGHARYPPESPFCLISLTDSLTEPGDPCFVVSLDDQGALANFLSPLSGLGLQACTAMPGSLHGCWFWVLNLGSHVYGASLLSTEPYPQTPIPFFNFFGKNLSLIFIPVHT